MNKHELETAIKVAKEQLKALTHETLRPNSGFKMRTHAQTLGGIVAVIGYYEKELAKLPKEKPAPRKED